MAYRLLRRGDTLAYEPRCTIYHRSRATEGEAVRTEWRNAVGLGACLGKHMLRGDLYAMKWAYWFLSALPASALRAMHHGKRLRATTHWLFFVGVPYGVLKRCVYALRSAHAGALSHG